MKKHSVLKVMGTIMMIGMLTGCSGKAPGSPVGSVPEPTETVGESTPDTSWVDGYVKDTKDDGLILTYIWLLPEGKPVSYENCLEPVGINLYSAYQIYKACAEANNAQAAALFDDMTIGEFCQWVRLVHYVNDNHGPEVFSQIIMNDFDKMGMFTLVTGEVSDEEINKMVDEWGVPEGERKYYFDSIPKTLSFMSAADPAEFEAIANGTWTPEMHKGGWDFNLDTYYVRQDVGIYIEASQEMVDKDEFWAFRKPREEMAETIATMAEQNKEAICEYLNKQKEGAPEVRVY